MAGQRSDKLRLDRARALLNAGEKLNRIGAEDGVGVAHGIKEKINAGLFAHLGKSSSRAEADLITRVVEALHQRIYVLTVTQFAQGERGPSTHFGIFVVELLNEFSANFANGLLQSGRVRPSLVGQLAKKGDAEMLGFSQAI